MPKSKFFQTRFEDQTINCKKMPNVQKHEETYGFVMILRVRSFGRWKKKLWKSHDKLKLKPDMHVWWMFDWFWIDFERISRSLWAKISLRNSLGMNFGSILSSFWDHGRALERWWGAWCWQINLSEPSESCQNLHNGIPNRVKLVKRNNHQRIDKLYVFEGGFLVSLDPKMMIFANTFRRSNYQL